MTSPTSTIPVRVQAAIDMLLHTADQAESFTIPDADHVLGGTVTLMRHGASNVYVAHRSEEMSWHTHDSEAEAVECFNEKADTVRGHVAYLNGGGDGRALVLALETGMPVEVAEHVLPQILAQMEGEPDIPVPAVGRAPVQEPVTVDLGPDTPWTGMYL